MRKIYIDWTPGSYHFQENRANTFLSGFGASLDGVVVEDRAPLSRIKRTLEAAIVYANSLPDSKGASLRDEGYVFCIYANVDDVGKPQRLGVIMTLEIKDTLKSQDLADMLDEYIRCTDTEGGEA